MKATVFFARGVAVAAAALLTTASAQAATYVASGTFRPYTGVYYDLLSSGSFSGFFELPDGTLPFPGNKFSYVDYRYQFDLFNKNGVKVATVRDGPDAYAYSYLDSRGSSLYFSFHGGPGLWVVFDVPLNFSGGTAAIVNGDVRSGTGDNTYAYILAGSVSAIPEPASWGMMIFGFGLIGGAMRRAGRSASLQIETAGQVPGQG